MTATLTRPEARRRPVCNDPVGQRLERWARQAVLIDRPATELTAPPRVLADIDELVAYERRFWRERNTALLKDGVPTALQGSFTGMVNTPPAANLGTVTTATTTTTALWTSSLHSPINANAIQAPQAYRLAASGLMTTVGTPGNGGFDPRVGAGSTINTAIAGTTMGAVSGIALTASVTNAFWRVEGDLTIRSVGAPGANSSVIFLGSAAWTNAAGPASKANDYLFGGTAASVDISVAAGFSLGFVATVASNTLTVQQVHWVPWN